MEGIERFVQEDVVGSFTGYAPVLEVIGAHIAHEGNAYKFLVELKSSDQTLHGIDVVARIMGKLLEREQQKVTEAFQRRIKDKCENDIPLSEIYSVKEQLIRIINYVLFGELDLEAYRTIGVPIDYMDEYNAVLQTFIP